jgi:hypothetical protein
MPSQLNIPLVVNSVLQSATQWPGGSGVLVARSSLWNSNTGTLNFQMPDGTYFATSTTVSADAITTAFSLPQGLIKMTGLASPLTLGTVVITGTAGQFSCGATTLAVGNLMTISGTLGGTGSIAGYANPTTYVISATNGTTTFTLTAVSGAALVTTTGTPSGLTYTVGNINVNAQVIPANLN